MGIPDVVLAVSTAGAAAVGPIAEKADLSDQNRDIDLGFMASADLLAKGEENVVRSVNEVSCIAVAGQCLFGCSTAIQFVRCLRADRPNCANIIEGVPGCSPCFLLMNQYPFF